MGEPLAFKGSLAGHSGWVTAIATSSENPDMILTSSRGEYGGKDGGGKVSTKEGRDEKDHRGLTRRQDHHCLAALA